MSTRRDRLAPIVFGIVAVIVVLALLWSALVPILAHLDALAESLR